MTEQFALSQGANAKPAVKNRIVATQGQSICHPWVDFLCLGGASIVILPAVAMLPETARPSVILLTWVMATILNFPHFAASYLLFYRRFWQRAFSRPSSREMQLRYIAAGILAPAALITYCAIGYLLGDAMMLGLGANLMLFLVGWHYTKQGYGILIVTSVYNRQFFNDSEKNILRYNAYAVWLMMWLLGNTYVSEANLWGLAIYSFAIPKPIVYMGAALAFATTVFTLKIFGRRLLGQDGGLPITGAVAYLTTLYLWLFARYEPMALLFVPAFHSLQYLLIVGRYEVNRNRALADGAVTRTVKGSMLRFALTTVILGLTGFWFVPATLDYVVNYDRAVLGGTVFLFMFWIVINVHHYLLDNVIWRRENPETGAHLFAPGPTK